MVLHLDLLSRNLEYLRNQLRSVKMEINRNFDPQTVIAHIESLEETLDGIITTVDMNKEY